MKSKEWQKLKEYISANPEKINDLERIKKTDICHNAERESNTPKMILQKK